MYFLHSQTHALDGTIQRPQGEGYARFRSLMGVWLLLVCMGLSCRTWATPFNVTYTISYDPLTEITTLANTASSEGPLPFWTVTGDEAGTLLGLPINEEVQIDAVGMITKGGQPWDWSANRYDARKWTLPRNVESNEKDIEINNVSKDNQKLLVIVSLKGQIVKRFYIEPGESYTCPKGYHCYIRPDKGGSYTLKDTFIYALEDTETEFGPGWDVFPSDQYVIKLISGTLLIQDNTGSFLSPWTDSGVNVGCMVPEPNTWLLLATGLIGLFAHGWRKQQPA